MNKSTLLYLVFALLLPAALAFDLGFLSKKNKPVTPRAAFRQTVFWVLLSLAFCAFIRIENAGGTGRADSFSYLTAYILEWSLSLDNIFVFIIIFAFFRVKENDYARTLLLGIIMAVLFRIIFIALGTDLVARFNSVLYLFGAFLIFTGIKMAAGSDVAFDPEKNRAYLLLKKRLRVADEISGGEFFVMKNGKRFFTRLALAVAMLGLIDIAFALDSIPAVFSVIPDPSKKMLIYSSNIFAVLGLRSMFFLLRGAADRFAYLQQGIAAVLLFTGLKMLLPALGFFGVSSRYLYIPGMVSLTVILVCILSAVIFSLYRRERNSTVKDGQN